jgi:hypothetical protein
LNEIIKPEIYRFILTNLIPEENGRIIGFGYQKAAEDSVAYFTVLEMDDNFSILTEKKYRTGFYYLDYINVEKLNDCYLIVGSGKYTSYPNYHLFSYIVNSSYDTLRSKVYPEEGICYAFDMIPALDGNYLKVFTRGFEQQTGTGGQIILMDSMLNRVGYTGVPEFVFSYNDAIYIDEAHYLLTGKTDIYEKGRSGAKMAIMIMDTADIMQDIQILGAADTTNYPGFYSNLDFVNENEIYYGGIKNLSSGYFVPADSWFFLNKLNSNLEVQWQKFYGGDANYNLWNLIATQDGGCLMAGTRYDYITQTNLRDIYILKVDSDGLVTGFGNEPPQIVAHDAIVYPNPGSSYLKVQSGPQINGALFEMHNMAGKPVTSEILNNRLMEINTASLPTGAYTYRVIWQGRLVGWGKWVKR